MRWTLLREIILAVSMISLIILSLWAVTGQLPPLVVVESDSMVHNADSGEVGSIDAGDLVLVHSPGSSDVITYAEATEPFNPHYGYASHGMEGDVIIYNKNGKEGTPIIHRAILEAVPAETSELTANGTCEGEAVHDKALGICIHTWDVPGTNLRNVTSIDWQFDGMMTGYFDCKRDTNFNHGEVGLEPFLKIESWKPQAAGFLTLGDNNKCSIDQGWSASRGGVQGANGLFDSDGAPVGPASSSHLVGIAGAEIPWLGTVKLMLAGGDSPGTEQVPNATWGWLFLSIATVLAIPIAIEPLLNRFIKGSPEVAEFELERKQMQA